MPIKDLFFLSLKQTPRWHICPDYYVCAFLPTKLAKCQPANTWEAERQAARWPSGADGHQDLLVKVIKKSWIIRLIISEKIKLNPWRFCAILTDFLRVLLSLLVQRRTLIKSEMKSVRSHAACRQQDGQYLLQGQEDNLLLSCWIRGESWINSARDRYRETARFIFFNSLIRYIMDIIPLIPKGD